MLLYLKERLSKMTDEGRFFDAIRRVSLEEQISCGIGTLSERSLHKVLKLYYEPRGEYHEVEFLGCVADIMRDGEIIEIQTGALSKLKGKLERFLPSSRVTVVHPITVEKTLCTVMADGTVRRRKSPARGSIYSMAFELYKIRELLLSDNLIVRVVFLASDEYRYSSRGRHRGEKLNTLPRRVISEMDLSTPEDYRVFLPVGLPEEFTSSEFLAAIKSRSRYDYYAIRLLAHLGIITRTEDRGRAHVYKINSF